MRRQPLKSEAVRSCSMAKPRTVVECCAKLWHYFLCIYAPNTLEKPRNVFTADKKSPSKLSWRQTYKSTIGNNSKRWFPCNMPSFLLEGGGIHGMWRCHSSQAQLILHVDFETLAPAGTALPSPATSSTADAPAEKYLTQEGACEP